MNSPVCMANSVDPDQTPHFAASDLGLYYLQRPIIILWMSKIFLYVWQIV